MKRVLFFLAAVLVLGAILLPAALGLVAEKRHAGILAGIAMQPDAAEVEFYRRGWFTSSARHRVSLGRDDGGAVSDGPRSALIIDTRIVHGPLALTGEIFEPSWGIAHGHSTLVLEDGEGQRRLPGIVDTRIDLDGGGRLTYDAGAGRRTLASGQNLVWAGGKVMLQYDESWHRLETIADLGSLRLAGPESVLAIESIRLFGTFSRSPYGLRSLYYGPWTGRIDLHVDRFASGPTPAPEGLMEGASLLTRFDADDQGFRLGARAAAARVREGDWEGSDAVVDIQFAGSDIGAFQTFIEGLRERAISATDKAWTIDAEAVVAEFQPLLRSGGTVELAELSIPTRHGKVTAEMNVSLASQDGAVDLSNLGSALEAGMSLRVPRALIDGTTNGDTPYAKNMQNLLKSGLFKTTGSDYTITASYRSSVLTVNGASLPLLLSRRNMGQTGN